MSIHIYNHIYIYVYTYIHTYIHTFNIYMTSIYIYIYIYINYGFNYFAWSDIIGTMNDHDSSLGVETTWFPQAKLVGGLPSLTTRGLTSFNRFFFRVSTKQHQGMAVTAQMCARAFCVCHRTWIFHRIQSSIRWIGFPRLISSFLGQSTGWVETNPNPSLLVWEYRTVHQQRFFCCRVQWICLREDRNRKP